MGRKCLYFFGTSGRAARLRRPPTNVCSLQGSLRVALEGVPNGGVAGVRARARDCATSESATAPVAPLALNARRSARAWQGGQLSLAEVLDLQRFERDAPPQAMPK